MRGLCRFVPLLLLGCAPADPVDPNTSLDDAEVEVVEATNTQVDAHTIDGSRHFIDDYDAVLPDGRVHVVVEIPTGTNAKWEVDKSDGNLKWEMRDGKPRVVQFLGYPGNYGMVPRTLLAKDDGGDGDPLDVLVLGQPVDRGAVIAVRLIGVLRLLDDGEQDDKLIAVRDGTPFAEVGDIAALQARFPGVTTQIEGWFTCYKGPGEMQSLGFAAAADARKVLDRAIATYADRKR